MINYMDRQALSILAPTIQKELGIDNGQYGRIVQCFLLAYTVTHFFGGRLVDRVGARIAETAFVVWWSVANMLTCFASGFLSLAFFRTLLGLGEPGHYSASGKAIAEWFSPKERGIAVGMLTMGGTLGAALAVPLLAYLAGSHGWRWAFVITGALGLLPAAIWYWIYGYAPKAAPNEKRAKPVARGELLRQRPLWLLMGARMITDPLWYFYLFWFPKFLQESRGFTLAEMGATAWVVYLSADAGSVCGGWLSGRLVQSGIDPSRARLMVMGGAAAILSLNFVLPQLPGREAALAMASLFCFCEMVWMTNCVVLQIDLFPKEMVGSVAGTIGAGGSLGGFFSTSIVAYLVTNYSYEIAFRWMSILHPIAIGALGWWLLRGRSADEKGILTT